MVEVVEGMCPNCGCIQNMTSIAIKIGTLGRAEWVCKKCGEEFGYPDNNSSYWDWRVVGTPEEQE